jgi:hypothetical protein
MSTSTVTISGRPPEASASKDFGRTSTILGELVSLMRATVEPPKIAVATLLVSLMSDTLLTTGAPIRADRRPATSRES